MVCIWQILLIALKYHRALSDSNDLFYTIYLSKLREQPFVELFLSFLRWCRRWEQEEQDYGLRELSYNIFLLNDCNQNHRFKH